MDHITEMVPVSKILKKPFNRKKIIKRGRDNKKVSDDESICSYPSQIGFSDASNKQASGQSTASKGRSRKRPSIGGSESLSVASSHRSVYSLGPVKRKQDIERKNASSKHILGVFYLRKKEYDKADEYLRCALEARMNLLGEKHGLVLETQLVIADILIVRQKDEEAIDLLQKVETTIRTLQRGEAHISDDDSVYSEETDGSKLLGGKSIDFDELHRTTLDKLESLGASPIVTEENNEESEIDEEAIEREKELQQIKLSTVDDIKKGLDLYANGEIFKAKEYYYENLDNWINILKPDDEILGKVLEDLGDIEFYDGNYEKAKALFEEAERTTKNVSDEESTDRVRLLQKLGMAEEKLLDKEAADKFFDEAYTLYEKQLEFDADKEKVSLGEDLIQKASILFMKGDYEGAKIQLSDVMRKTEHKGGNRNPLFLNMIGMVLFAESRYDEARIYFEQAYKAAESNKEKISPRQRVNILYNLGFSNVHILQFKDALVNFKLALDELEKCTFCDFDKKTEQVRILTKLGHSSFHLDELELANDYFVKAFSIQMDLCNDDTRTVALNLRRYIGLTRAHQGRYDDALYVFEGVLYSHDRDDWPESIVCAKTLIDMSEIYFICGSLKLSREKQMHLAQLCCKRAFEIYSAHKLTDDHPYVKQSRNLQNMINLVDEV